MFIVALLFACITVFFDLFPISYTSFLVVLLQLSMNIYSTNQTITGRATITLYEFDWKMIEAIDQEMRKRKLTCTIVVGDSTFGNPDLFYVVGANIARGGVFIKIKSQPPLIIVSNIDVGSAEKGRVKRVETYSDYEYDRIVMQHGLAKARGVLYDKILRRLRVRGRIGFYGKTDLSQGISAIDFLRRKKHKVVGENTPTLLDALRETKDETEISRIREIGRRTEKIVEQTTQFLRNCTVRNKELFDAEKPVTVGMVKSLIGRLTAEQNLINTNGLIFSVGRDSADPHNEGRDQDRVREGLPIVFDIFPQEPGGYWFDTTRTYVIGKASDEIRRMHETVLEAQLLALDELRAGVDGGAVTERVCRVFEKKGYKTPRDLAKGDVEAKTTGFIHSLGHGIGLTIGERPSLSVITHQELQEGHVTSVEPGLYKPGIGGVRIEDAVVIRKRGIENLSTLRKDLEI